MKAALKPFLVLLVVAGLGLSITIYGGHVLGVKVVKEKLEAKAKAKADTKADAKIEVKPKN